MRHNYRKTWHILQVQPYFSVQLLVFIAALFKCFYTSFWWSVSSPVSVATKFLMLKNQPDRMLLIVAPGFLWLRRLQQAAVWCAAHATRRVGVWLDGASAGNSQAEEPISLPVLSLVGVINQCMGRSAWECTNICNAKCQGDLFMPISFKHRAFESKRASQSAPWMVIIVVVPD